MFSSTVDTEWFPTCAVFDCDGVLLDSETIWEQIQEETFATFKVPFTDEAREALVGSAASDLVNMVVKLRDFTGSSAEEETAFHQQVRHYVHDNEAKIIERGITPIPGALELIKKLSEAMPVAVASNSSSELLTRKLSKFGHKDYLTTWVGANDVQDPKPAPDMYSEAIRRLGGNPARTFTVEDSAAGAQAARESGSVTFIYTHGNQNPPQGQGYFDSFTDPDFLAQVDSWVKQAKEAQN